MFKISNAINAKQLELKNDQNLNHQNLKAIYEILKFFNMDQTPIPTNIKKTKNQIKFLLDVNNIVTRTIELEPNWFKYGTGAILIEKKNDRTLVALIPSKTFGCYKYVDFETQKKIKINKKNSNMFKETAILCYEPMPETQLNLKILTTYLKKEISIIDLLTLLTVSIILSFIGLITPKMVQLIFSSVVELKNLKIIALIGIFLFTTTISEHFFKIIKILITQKIVSKLVLKLESGIIFRTISMPISFFNNLNSGEIFARIRTLKLYFENLANRMLQTWLFCALSVIYFIQIFSYAPALVVPAIIFILAFLIFSTIAATTRAKIGFKKMDLKSKETTKTLEIISGIEKIKLTGSEKSAFVQWANTFAKALKIEYTLPLTLKINKIVLNAIKMFATATTYIVAAIYCINPANFFAFSIAFSIINDAFFHLAETIIELAKIKPLSKFLKPIFETRPEQTKHKKTINKLSGAITVNNLNFSYRKEQPQILEKLSFKINPKQTVAIFGKNGSGKSTLIRLLIGFEQPTSGSILFDENNLNSLNLKLLRKKIGIVIESGKLFNGNIFLNIAAKNNNISLKQAWYAAKIAQIDSDIAKMPMKMNTLITQEGKEFSISQVQRILLARAVVTKPKILILDGALCDLETEIQKKILKQLKQLNCTIIFSTNDSTILNFCDKVIDLNRPL